MNAAILKHQTAASKDLPPESANKWEVMRELAAARTAFDLSDRDLTVLQALVSFHQKTILGGNDADLIVHPSNKSICERLNGMPCSTMRRHLANLVQTGFVVRRDSPNGKRYARRYGDDKIAFGFDLSPLVRRFPEICAAAEAIRVVEERHKRLRVTVSLMRRDLAGLAEYGELLRPDLAVWARFSDLAALTARDLRRKLDLADLKAIETALKVALDDARGFLEPPEAENMSTNDVDIERHYQNSNKDSYDSEPCLEKAKGKGCAIGSGSEGGAGDVEPLSGETSQDSNLPNVPLGLVLKACTEFRNYSEAPVRHWHELVRTAHILCPMMGISPSAWEDAQRHMGPEQAAAVVVAMLERFSEIHSPGGYLRSLTGKAANGQFSCGPMIIALMHKDAA